MPNIFYYTDARGRSCALWPGVSKRVPVTHADGTITHESRKSGQLRLGLVVDKDNLLFYKEEEGFFQFNPVDQSITEIPLELVPSWMTERSLRPIRPPVLIDFGGSYFLDELVKGIGYTSVLDAITYQNRDRLKSMLQYYILSNKAANAAEGWYQHNFTKFLYPQANLASARISEFLEALGSDENRRDFLMAHIPYLLKSTDEELCILVDSTGMPNKCGINFTRVSAHEGDVNIEFRVIVVVQKSTGLPVYYEMIPGNVVDVSTIDMIIEKLKNMGYKVSYSLGDSAYSCPAVLERLVLSGIDFMTRLNPAYNTYKTTVEEHLEDLEKNGKNVLFNNRTVKILKIPTIIGTNKEGERVTGFVYLCRDINSWHGKSNHFLNSKKAKSYTSEEREAECDRFGLFALVSTIELKEEEVLKEYYIRQAVEQFFDYAKNYAKLLPVRCHKEETIKGHLLLGFIATFILVLIKNRLNILDSPYARIPLTLKDEGTDDERCITIDNGDGTDIEILIEQEPMMTIFKGCPSALFGELQFQKAEVYANELVPSVPTAL
ncbi:MAG: transposase, partial [Spirochaetales bacterium]|nr:transposase [Spirochaetales bacterium]